MELILALKKFAVEVLTYWKQLLVLAIIVILMWGSMQYGISETTKKYEEQIKVAAEKDIQAHESFIKEKQYIAEQFEQWRSTHPKIKEVTTYVNTGSDTNCIINDGFVRVHNAAATGQQIGSPSESDGAASQVKLSLVASTVASNYETCLYEFKKLESLQSIVKAYQESQK